MTKPKKAEPTVSQDQLDDLAAEVAAILNDGGSHTKEFWKAFIKRHRKRTRAAGKLLCAERTMTMYQVDYEYEHLALHQAVWRQRQRSSGSFRVCAAVRQSAVLLN
jgi:hypothetical protein